MQQLRPEGKWQGAGVWPLLTAHPQPLLPAIGGSQEELLPPLLTSWACCSGVWMQGEGNRCCCGHPLAAQQGRAAAALQYQQHRHQHQKQSTSSSASSQRAAQGTCGRFHILG